MPRFLLFRCFILCLLLAAGLMPHPAGAVDIKHSEADLSGKVIFKPDYDYWLTPFPSFLYPFVIHLSAPQRQEDPAIPMSYFDAGRLILSEHQTLIYVPGEIADPRISSWVTRYNEYLDAGISHRHPMSTESWDHLLLGLTTLVQDDVVVDHFAVTCGKVPNPDYVLRYEMPPNGLTVNGNPVSFGKALNPLPGMQMMTLRDFESPDTVWCPQDKAQHTPK